MTLETLRIKELGPDTMTISPSDPNKQVGDKRDGETIIAKTNVGDRVCSDRQANLCPYCIAAGWAAQRRCEIPIKE